MALDRLIEAIKRTGNPSVVGLDPRLEYIPDFIVNKAFKEQGETAGAAAPFLKFKKRLTP